MGKLKAEQLLQVLKKLGVDSIYNMEKDFDEAIEELEELNKKLEASKEYFNLKLNGTFDNK